MSQYMKRALIEWGFWLMYLGVCGGVGLFLGHHNINTWLAMVGLMGLFASYYYMDRALKKWLKVKFPD